MRAVSILGAATSWTGHSLKIRIGGRSPARRLVAGLLFTASRTEPASYAYLCLGGERRKHETESENDREPAQPQGVKPSDVLEKTARIEAAVTEAGERLRARWQLEQAG